MGEKEKRRKFSFLITVLAGASVGHVLRQLKRHSIDLKYFWRVLLTVLVSIILEPFRWWENLIWERRIKKVKLVKPPVFIIGFWRSGTTLLHNLLCQTEGAAYITTYQTVFPNLLLSHSWWFKPIIGKFWPTHRPFDDVKMGLDFPQEEEIALANLQDVSFYNFLYFPKDFERFYERELLMKGLSDRKLNHWKQEYIKMIRKSFLNVKGDRYFSKNPSNMARISQLIKVFPDARFIFIYRDPYKTVESFYRFFHEVLPAVEVQQSEEKLSRKRVARIYNDMIRKYFGEKHLIPKENLLEIRFEDFRKNIHGNLENIFKQFDIPGFGKNIGNFEEYIESQKDYQHKSYDIDPETIQWVNEYASDILEKLQYPKR